MFDVLVTGAHSRQGIVVLRSLARRGVRTLLVGARPHSAGFYSRYAREHAYVPFGDNREFVDGVLDLARRHGIPHIFPVTERSLVALDQFREQVDAVSHLLAPSSQAIRTGLDKKRTLEIAEAQNVPITKTLYIGSVEEAESVAESWGYPVVFKPRGRVNDDEVVEDFDFKVLYAFDRSELRQVLARCKHGVYPIMQEYAYGPHTQFVCFLESTRAHSYFQDDAVRMLPLTGGVGTRLCSRKVVDELAEQSIRIFRAMKLEGCAQAQFKGPGQDGRYRFLEVSVRLPASVGSAVYSGIDLPWMQYRYFSGQPVEPVTAYEIGKSTRWFHGDTLTVAKWLVGETRSSADALPSKARVLASWMADNWRPGLKHFIETFSDPLPGLVDDWDLAPELAQIVVRRILQSRRPAATEASDTSPRAWPRGGAPVRA